MRDNSTAFACVDCDSPAVIVPRELIADAVVWCDGCGRALCTWQEYCSQIAAALSKTPGRSVDLIRAQK